MGLSTPAQGGSNRKWGSQMETQDFINDLIAFLPTAVAAIALLIGGWIIALFVASLVRAGMRRAQISTRVGKLVTGAEPEDTAVADRWVGRAVFWIIILFTLVGFFQVLGLSGVSGPLTGFLNEIFVYAPRLIGPAVLLVVAWIVAVVLRALVQRGLKTLKFDERLSSETGLSEASTTVTTETIASAVYWLTFLIFLPAILGGLQLGGLLDPVKEMVREFLSYLPNLFGAAVILLVGWFVAHLVRTLVVKFLAAVGTDSLPQRIGIQTEIKEQRLSGMIGLIVFALILIPVIIASLQALELETITQPASAMLGSFLDAVPAIFGAAILLAITYVVARVVASLSTSLLEGIGFDELSTKLGLGEFSVGDKTSPAKVVGYLVLIAIMLFATIEALSLMGFASVSDMVAEFLAFAGNVLLGIFIIGLGLFLGKLVDQGIRSAKVAQAGLLATVGRVAVIILGFAMGLKQMGIADEVILLAFGISLGAVAVAAAIAFGLGSRDVAKALMDKWVDESKD